MTANNDHALDLMHLSMPTFEKFLEHATELRSECDKAGAMTPERAMLFDQYRDALIGARKEYEDLIAAFICDKFTDDEIDALIGFYSGPLHKTVEKALGLGAVVNNIGTAWQTKVLERCPDTWKMLMENIGEWQEKNTPSNSEVIIPDAPPGREGWKRINLKSIPAEEYDPTSEITPMSGNGVIT